MLIFHRLYTSLTRHISINSHTHRLRLYLLWQIWFFLSAVPALSGCKAGFLTSTYCRTNNLFKNTVRTLCVWLVVITTKHHYDVRFNLTCFCKGSLFVLLCIYKCLYCVLATVLLFSGMKIRTGIDHWHFKPGVLIFSPDLSPLLIIVLFSEQICHIHGDQAGLLSLPCNSSQK